MTPVLEDIWRLQREWSQRANRLKATYSRWQQWVLVLAIAAAFLSTLGTQLGAAPIAPWVAGAGAAALALVAIVGQWKTTPDRLREWIQARSVSEELKTLVYTYLAGCGEATADSTREQVLEQRVSEVVQAASNVAIHAAVADARPLPEVHDLESYVAVRIDSRQPKGQIQYYRDSAARSQRAVNLSRGLRFALAGAAAVVGALGAAFDASAVTVWMAVVTTAVAAFAAHVAGARHELLAISYKATEIRLSGLLRKYKVSSDPDPCRFVRECESAISSQNEGWMAEFMKPSEPASS